MFDAVCADLSQLADVLVMACPLLDRDDLATTFHAASYRADVSLLIAPECDDILATRCQWIEEAGGRLLGPASAAVRLTADKLALGEYLLRKGIPTPRGWPLPANNELPFPLVCKPRAGAGSLATFWIGNAAELADCLDAARRDGYHDDMIATTYVPGVPVSVAFLIGPRQCVALTPTMQHLSDDGRFRYLGGSLPLSPELAERARCLARRAVAVIPDLFGYVGVDLVLGPAADGREDYVIEVNPRLTTSYVGLRAWYQTNLMHGLLAVVQGQEPPYWCHGTEPILFTSDGRWRKPSQPPRD
ncbi:MAG: ATP-grasp domain-containing protein [Gemmataceae bacterium]